MASTVISRTGKQEKLIEAIQANWKAEMQGFVTYSYLADRARDPNTRRALRGIAAAEKHHADLWADRLHTLDAEVPAFEQRPDERVIEAQQTGGMASRYRSLGNSAVSTLCSA